MEPVEQDREVSGTTASTAERGRRPRRVTRWNIAALLILLLGGAGTLLAGQLWLLHWADTGVHIPINVRHAVDLPHGTTTVYYETGGRVPSRDPMLKIRDPYGVWIRARPPEQAGNFRMLFTGWSGRAVAQLNVDEEGTYTFFCSNPDALSLDEVPADDRIALLKEPDSLERARRIHKIILIAGASVTILLTIIAYAMHAATLHGRAAAQETEP